MLIVGVVFRGKSWLDGVMRTQALGPNCTEETIEMITSSPHYHQIRAVLLSRDLIDGINGIEPLTLHQVVSRPVIAIKFENFQKKENLKKIRPNNFESSLFYIGLNKKRAIKIIETTSHKGLIPESLRVADLILSEFMKKNHNL